MPTPTLLADLSFTSLKAMMVVAQTESVTRAADQLNRSQTTVSKSIQTLEQKLNIKLFDRSPNGMVLTPKGVVIREGIAEAAQQFQAAAESYQQMVSNVEAAARNPIFNFGVNYNRLQALVLVSQNMNFKEAAQDINTSTGSIYNSIHLLEQMLGTPLFERSSFGNRPTPFCEVLVRHIKLALIVLENVLDEVTNDSGQVSGEVRVAAFPSVRSFILPQACVEVKRANPDIRIVLKDGIYSDMEWQLRSGELDFLVSGLYDDQQKLSDDLYRIPLFNAPLNMIIRGDHPLLQQETINVDDLKPYSWILPPSGTVARKGSTELLESLGIEQPDCQIEAYSYSMLNEIIQQSNSIGLAFPHQYARDTKEGLLQVLPFEFDRSISIEITLRKHTTLSPSATVLKDALVRLSGSL